MPFLYVAVPLASVILDSFLEMFLSGCGKSTYKKLARPSLQVARGNIVGFVLNDEPRSF